MGQDKPGKFHPPAGKPSGVNKSEGLGVSATPPEKMEEYFELTSRYVNEEKEEMSDAARMNHPNRNTSKGEGGRGGHEIRFQNERNNSDAVTKDTGTNFLQEISLLDRKVFIELAAHVAPHCASVYMQTNESGSDVNDGVDKLR